MQSCIVIKKGDSGTDVFLWILQNSEVFFFVERLCSESVSSRIFDIH